MFYKLMKFIVPFLCVFALLIYLSGNDDLFENFTMNFLNRLSKTEIKNPANDIVDLLAVFDDIKNTFVDLTLDAVSGDVFSVIINFFKLVITPIYVGFALIKGLALVFYDVCFNIIAILRLLIDTTGVGFITK